MTTRQPLPSSNVAPFPSHIDGAVGRLQIVVEPAAPLRNGHTERQIAVVAHPHPLYGGTMDNAVVRRAANRLQHKGYDTVRFNFRGVGASEGAHDGGPGEVDDLAAVMDWCIARFGDAPVLLAGYSFGAATILRSAPRVETSGILLIAPPLSFHDLSKAPVTSAFQSRPGRAATPVALIYGGEDELTAPVHRTQTASWEARAEQELPGVGHDLGADGSADQRARFDEAVDRCLAKLITAPEPARRSVDETRST